MNESRIAEAIIATVCVHATSILADSLLLALVSILASVRLRISRLSVRTFAGERTRCVQTLATLAQPWYRFALVDI